MKTTIEHEKGKQVFNRILGLNQQDDDLEAKKIVLY